jgi:glycosyltransferase involved in cell wall biosynthesis
MVLYLGRLKAYKSVDVLIRAFALIKEKTPRAKLVIAGGGEESSILQRLAADLGFGHKDIEFTGRITEAEKISWLQQAWVFVNPSMIEGWGITSIEANACGVPVVASNVPGLRDSVKNPHTGYLVPHGDVEMLAERINRLIEHKPLRDMMGKEAIAWASNFDWDRSAEKSLALILGEDI